MKWGIIHFSLYLKGKRFRVQTDNNPLIYFVKSPNLDAMKHQWIGKLVPYDFSVEYQRGKLNVMADVLSRMTNWLGERETNSYLWMVEGNTSVKPLIGDQNEQQSQDDTDEYESLWPPQDQMARKKFLS